MSGGFWAGAVPWAIAAGALLFIGGVLIGVWAGYGRGWKHAEEEARWAREQAKTRALIDPPSEMKPLPEVAHEERTAWEDQALTLANEHPSSYMPSGLGSITVYGPVIEPTAVISPEAAITTGEIQAITDEMDAWLTKHVYSQPADYGAWVKQKET